MTQFTECHDKPAEQMRFLLAESGAKHISIVTDGALRISKSLCPIGPSVWQWLVCVSRNGKPVSEQEARSLAVRFVTDHEIDVVMKSLMTTQIWFKHK